MEKPTSSKRAHRRLNTVTLAADDFDFDSATLALWVSGRNPFKQSRLEESIKVILGLTPLARALGTMDQPSCTAIISVSSDLKTEKSHPPSWEGQPRAANLADLVALWHGLAFLRV